MKQKNEIGKNSLFENCTGCSICKEACPMGVIMFNEYINIAVSDY